jgi:hypothetical protein
MVMVASGVSNAPDVVCGSYTYTLNGTRATAIPTLSEWGMIPMVLSIMVAGFRMIRRRFTTA